MKLRFHPKARIELNKAVDFYEERRIDLGWEFFDEVQSTIQRILDFPEAWSQLSATTRRCLTNLFPYGVIYQVKADEVRASPSRTRDKGQATGNVDWPNSDNDINATGRLAIP